MGGGSLKWVPRSSKETRIIVFFRILKGWSYPLKWVILSGYVVDLSFLVKNF